MFNQTKPGGLNNPRISSTLLESGFMSDRANVSEMASWVQNPDNALSHAQQLATGIITNANETQPYDHQRFVEARAALAREQEEILVADNTSQDGGLALEQDVNLETAFSAALDRTELPPAPDESLALDVTILAENQRAGVSIPTSSS